jgi:hypothetical protein
MSASANFTHWAAACEALEAAYHDARPEAQIAAARVLVNEMLETLVRSLIVATRRSEVAQQRAADNVQAVIDAETDRLWARLDVQGRRIAQLEAVLAEHEEHEEHDAIADRSIGYNPQTLDER